MDHYGTVEEFTEYMDAMGLAYETPSPDDGEFEQALVRGSLYIDGTYRDRFPGTRTDGRAQPLAWPRTDATDAECEEIPDDEVPVEIERATYEAAWREFTSPGSLTPDYVASERTKSESVGPISVTYAVSDTTSMPDNQPRVPVIDGILDGLLGPHRVHYFGSAIRA